MLFIVGMSVGLLIGTYTAYKHDDYLNEKYGLKKLGGRLL